LNNDELNSNEKILISTILLLSSIKECFARNSYFSEILKLSKDRISKLLKKLEENGFIERKISEKSNNERIIIPLAKSTGMQVENKDAARSNTTEGLVVNNYHNKYSLNKKNKKENSNISFFNKINKTNRFDIQKDTNFNIGWKNDTNN
jgi:SOS-response transcriptional repressor LexA